MVELKKDQFNALVCSSTLGVKTEYIGYNVLPTPESLNIDISLPDKARYYASKALIPYILNLLNIIKKDHNAPIYDVIYHNIKIIDIDKCAPIIDHVSIFDVFDDLIDEYCSKKIDVMTHHNPNDIVNDISLLTVKEVSSFEKSLEEAYMCFINPDIHD